MTGTFRKLGFAYVLALATSTASALPPQGQDGFTRGVELLRKGRSQEALVEFQKVLASDLSSEEAYELWKATEHDVWLELLVEGGEFELVAKHLMGLVNVEHAARQADPDAIRELVTQVRGDDVVERRRAIRQLSANHGEYAVPLMLNFLGDPDDDDGRVKIMHALTEMDTDVVPPLIESLSSDDRFLRQNVALVLGRIGDPRAAGMLTRVADTDEDVGVQNAARQASQRCGSTGDAFALLLQQGHAYHNRSASVLRPHDYSEVVWSWGEDGLTNTPVPRYLYNEEMAKKAYYRAMEINPNSLEGRAGAVQAYVASAAKIHQRAENGEDIGDLGMQAAEAAVVVNSAGVEAIDLALQWAVASGDSSTGVALCGHLAHMAGAPTPGLYAALRSNDGPLRAESAAVLGHIALHSGQAAPPEVVAEMARTAGREVMQIAAVIDGETHRSESIRGAMEAEGISVAVFNSGGAGISSLNRLPGVDLILVADRLPDMTTMQMLDEVRREPRYAETPVLLITEDPETAADAFGDAVTDTVTTSADADKVREALSGGVDGDREEANVLAARAAATLAALAAARQTDLSPAVDPLAAGMAHRPDAVCIPAAAVLAAYGSEGHLDDLLAVVVDDGRSDEVRVAAADGISGILGRVPDGLSKDEATALYVILSSGDSSLAVRQAASRAIGRMALDPATRAEIMQQVRVNASTEG